jgi:hypothetical protein
MEQKDCFFFIAPNENGEDQVNCCCVECQQKENVEKAMYWPGSTKGYGPFDYHCHYCKEAIALNEAK